MTDEERKIASIDQIYTYAGSQYTKWHLAVVKSVKKILLNLDDFYGTITPELGDAEFDIVNVQIRNGWFYEAVAHAEQAIEDLFATIMSLKDLSFFTKDVLFYNASNAKRYIWDFDADNIEYLCDQFGYPYFNLDDEWENKEVFERYKTGVLLTQKYVKELRAFHKKYYDDYCQYKHGLSVGLIPLGNMKKKGNITGNGSNAEKQEKKNPLEGALFTFHNGTMADYERRTGEFPNPLIMLKPGMQHHLRELHDEGNLLYYSAHHVDMEEVEAVTSHACILLNSTWQTILNFCENENAEFQEVAFPKSDDLDKCYVIGFPKE